MTVEFQLYTMSSLVNGTKYPLQKDELARATKTQIITKSGLRFKRDGWMLKSKENTKIIGGILHQMGYNTLFGVHATITKESLNNIKERLAV